MEPKTPDVTTEPRLSGRTRSPARRDDLPEAVAGRIPPAALSAASLVVTDAFGLKRLLGRIGTADSVGALRSAVADMPGAFVAMTRAGVSAPTTMRAYTTLCDAIVCRLVGFTLGGLGAPPVPFAWLAFGSGGRGELCLFSDLDNGLAYADCDDPAVEDYFRRFALEVNGGLTRCGFALDPHGVVATDPDWRMPVSRWVEVFADCLPRWDDDAVMRAAIGFDVRQVAGDLQVVPLLHEVIRQAPRYSRFLLGMAQLGAEIPSPLGFRRRLKDRVDLKQHGLLPVQNLARYYACAGGVTQAATLDRLAAVRDDGGRGGDVAGPLGEAYEAMAHLFARHQADAHCGGTPPEAPLDSGSLDAGERADLQAALRVLGSVQRSLPRRAAF